MTKGALYWRKKDEKTGKWTYQKVHAYSWEIKKVLDKTGGYPVGWKLIQEEE